MFGRCRIQNRITCLLHYSIILAQLTLAASCASRCLRASVRRALATHCPKRRNHSSCLHLSSTLCSQCTR
ncbi:hypothetical protein PF008_g24922 [Phytophthora fragariae]|uniref:Secreted protein n=1 Tax=Phytophthora fragariae TaxID=53985 RepID=A0A6G0QLE5_9STRA|nr:hypothetical protein PF008_g24922 [Phytophthora fragariae]